MTPLPKKKRSGGRQRKHRAEIILSLNNLVVCKNCGAKIKQHTACFKCGYYNNKMVKPIKVSKAEKQKG